MGINSGFIATHVGIAGGAEDIFVPEYPKSVDEVVGHVTQAKANGKLSSIIVTAEGQKPGRAYDLAEAIRKKCGTDPRVCILGHVQRGGTPTAADRILASRMGAFAVDCILKGQSQVMAGLKGESIVAVPFAHIFDKKNEKKPAPAFLELARLLAL